MNVWTDVSFENWRQNCNSSDLKKNLGTCLLFFFSWCKDNNHHILLRLFTFRLSYKNFRDSTVYLSDHPSVTGPFYMNHDSLDSSNFEWSFSVFTTNRWWQIKLIYINCSNLCTFCLFVRKLQYRDSDLYLSGFFFKFCNLIIILL